MRTRHKPNLAGEPTWEVAELFPPRGTWTEGEYLTLRTNHLIELSDGNLEVLAMPTTAHQVIVFFLARVLAAFVEARNLGTVLPAPLRVQLWEGKFREPDVLLMLARHAARMGDQFWRGADLVMEVVSADDPARDLDIKRVEYARAGIKEYWIADPRTSSITALTLSARRKSYRVAGEYGVGSQAASVLLPGFVVDVAGVFPARD